MGRKITDIYEEYKIFPMLQLHMLRVAAVANMICDNLDIPIDKNDIVSACLLHDMGNIVKFKWNVLPELFANHDLEYWKGIQNEYIQKYGDNEHEVNLKIMKELGLSQKMIDVVDQNRFSWLCKHKEGDDINVKIVHYSDGRVNPYGVVSYEGRMDEAKKRYSNNVLGRNEEERQKLVSCGLEIEKQIFAHCKIKPEDITDESVAPIIEELKNFVILQ